VTENPLKRFGVIEHPDGSLTVTTKVDRGEPPPFDPPTEPGATVLDGGWVLVVWEEDEADGVLHAQLFNPDEMRALRAWSKTTGPSFETG
jgi:hypothetical protein